MEFGKRYRQSRRKKRRTQQRMELYHHVQNFVTFSLKEDLVMARGQDIITTGNQIDVKDFSTVDVMEMKTIFMLNWHAKQFA